MDWRIAVIPATMIPIIIIIIQLRKHSFISTIEEILYKSDELDVIRIGLIGDMHSGKTTLSLAIAHRLHLDSKTPFTIKIFEKKRITGF